MVADAAGLNQGGLPPSLDPPQDSPNPAAAAHAEQNEAGGAHLLADSEPAAGCLVTSVSVPTSDASVAARGASAPAAAAAQEASLAPPCSGGAGGSGEGGVSGSGGSKRPREESPSGSGKKPVLRRPDLRDCGPAVAAPSPHGQPSLRFPARPQSPRLFGSGELAWEADKGAGCLLLGFGTALPQEEDSGAGGPAAGLTSAAAAATAASPACGRSLRQQERQRQQQQPCPDEERTSVAEEGCAPPLACAAMLGVLGMPRWEEPDVAGGSDSDSGLGSAPAEGDSQLDGRRSSCSLSQRQQRQPKQHHREPQSSDAMAEAVARSSGRGGAHMCHAQEQQMVGERQARATLEEVLAAVRAELQAERRTAQADRQALRAAQGQVAALAAGREAAGCSVAALGAAPTSPQRQRASEQALQAALAAAQREREVLVAAAVQRLEEAEAGCRAQLAVAQREKEEALEAAAAQHAEQLAQVDCAHQEAMQSAAASRSRLDTTITELRQELAMHSRHCSAAQANVKKAEQALCIARRDHRAEIAAAKAEAQGALQKAIAEERAAGLRVQEQARADARRWSEVATARQVALAEQDGMVASVERRLLAEQLARAEAERALAAERAAASAGGLPDAGQLPLTEAERALATQRRMNHSLGEALQQALKLAQRGVEVQKELRAADMGRRQALQLADAKDAEAAEAREVAGLAQQSVAASVRDFGTSLAAANGQAQVAALAWIRHAKSETEAAQVVCREAREALHAAEAEAGKLREQLAKSRARSRALQEDVRVLQRELVKARQLAVEAAGGQLPLPLQAEAGHQQAQRVRVIALGVRGPQLTPGAQGAPPNLPPMGVAEKPKRAARQPQQRVAVPEQQQKRQKQQEDLVARAGKSPRLSLGQAHPLPTRQQPERQRKQRTDQHDQQQLGKQGRQPARGAQPDAYWLDLLALVAAEQGSHSQAPAAAGGDGSRQSETEAAARTGGCSNGGRGQRRPARRAGLAQGAVTAAPGGGGDGGGACEVEMADVGLSADGAIREARRARKQQQQRKVVTAAPAATTTLTEIAQAPVLTRGQEMVMDIDGAVPALPGGAANDGRHEVVPASCAIRGGVDDGERQSGSVARGNAGPSGSVIETAAVAAVAEAAVDVVAMAGARDVITGQTVLPHPHPRALSPAPDVADVSRSATASPPASRSVFGHLGRRQLISSAQPHPPPPGAAAASCNAAARPLARGSVDVPLVVLQGAPSTAGDPTAAAAPLQRPLKAADEMLPPGAADLAAVAAAPALAAASALGSSGKRASCGAGVCCRASCRGACCQGTGSGGTTGSSAAATAAATAAGTGPAAAAGTGGSKRSMSLGAAEAVMRKVYSAVLAAVRKVPLVKTAFNMEPSLQHLSDYHDFIAPEEVMYLDLIEAKIGGKRQGFSKGAPLQYASIEALRADFQLIHTNCLAYNKPGRSLHNNPTARGVAAKMMAAVDKELAKWRGSEELVAAEAAAQSKQHRLECCACGKWRSVGSYEVFVRLRAAPTFTCGELPGRACAEPCDVCGGMECECDD